MLLWSETQLLKYLCTAVHHPLVLKKWLGHIHENTTKTTPQGEFGCYCKTSHCWSRTIYTSSLHPGKLSKTQHEDGLTLPESFIHYHWIPHPLEKKKKTQVELVWYFCIALLTKFVGTTHYLLLICFHGAPLEGLQNFTEWGRGPFW